MFTISTLADYLSVSEKEIRILVKQGKLEYSMIGNRYRFSREQVEKFIRSIDMSSKIDVPNQVKVSGNKYKELIQKVLEVENELHYYREQFRQINKKLTLLLEALTKAREVIR